jgi:predicted nucleic acid-binding protein
MSLSFCCNPAIEIVADTSAVINLQGTLHAAEVIRALPHRIAVTDQVCSELEDGTDKGHKSAEQLRVLIDGGLISRTSLSKGGAVVYQSLIAGTTTQTLDDGEAATIACALELGGIALIDERKALKLCAVSYPQLEIVSSAEVLMHQVLEDVLGLAKQREALLNALQRARMRVPAHLVLSVRKFIGDEAAARCPSLPRY